MQDVGVSIGVAFEPSISNEGCDREPICSAPTKCLCGLSNTLNWSAGKVKSRLAEGAQARPARIAKANRPGRP